MPALFTVTRRFCWDDASQMLAAQCREDAMLNADVADLPVHPPKPSMALAT